MSLTSEAYNRGHNILKLFDILPFFSFAESEMFLTTCKPIVNND